MSKKKKKNGWVTAVEIAEDTFELAAWLAMTGRPGKDARKKLEDEYRLGSDFIDNHPLAAAYVYEVLRNYHLEKKFQNDRGGPVVAHLEDGAAELRFKAADLNDQAAKYEERAAEFKAGKKGKKK